MIEEKLKRIGLSRNEILVYLAVLEHTDITPSETAKRTGLSRPSIYAIGKKLAKDGLILEENDGPTLRFLALPPEMVIKEAERGKREAEERLALAKSLVPELSLLPKSQHYSIPKVRFIDETAMADYIYGKTQDWDKSALGRDATWWGVQDSSLVKHLNEWLTWYWKRADPMIQTKIFTNRKEEGHTFKGQENFRRRMKYWNMGGNIRMTQLIFGDYILIINTYAKPHSLFEIYDAVTAEGLRQVFRGIWETV